MRAPRAAADEDMSQVPTEVFRHQLRRALIKHVRPPSKKDLGKKLRKFKPISTTRPVVDEMLSTSTGLPETDLASGIERETPGGAVKPTKKTSSGATIKIKLQPRAHLSSLLRLHDLDPTRGQGAARLHLPRPQERRGLGGKRVTMAAPPFKIKAYFPIGKNARMRLPTIAGSSNTVYMDENGDVTFGSMQYPPWKKQELRAEIYSSFVAMGQRRLPVDPDMYELVRMRLADERICGEYWQNSLPLPPPLPPPAPSPPRGKPSKRRCESSPRTAAAKKPKKAAAVRGEVQRVVREETGPWGKRRRPETWCVVEWSHEEYEPWWERWRNAGGDPGTPVRTWMGPREVRRYLAWEEWEAAKQMPAPPPAAPPAMSSTA